MTAVSTASVRSQEPEKCVIINSAPAGSDVRAGKGTYSNCFHKIVRVTINDRFESGLPDGASAAGRISEKVPCFFNSAGNSGMIRKNTGSGAGRSG